jgi:uncharacterized protein (TIGR02147 family)
MDVKERSMNNDTTLYDYLDYRSFVRDRVEKKKEENPAFSYRSVAYRMGCNPGFFNKVLKGERNLSPEHVLKLSSILKLKTQEKKYFELLVLFNQAKKQMEKDHYFEQLHLFRKTKVKKVPMRQYAMYTHWYYLVIRELLHFLPCPDDSDAHCELISRHLVPRVKPSEIREALRVLQQLGVVKKSRRGGLEVAERFITTGGEIPQVIINRILVEFMELARYSIDSFEREKRSLSTLTVSVSDEGYKTIQSKLEEYRREILDIVATDSGEINRVCHCNFHLFPVSRTYRRE